jgi:hypothetical protein
MPFEVALLAARSHTLEEVRAIAETMDPPLLVRDSVREGAVTVTELDDTAVATFGRPRLVETTVDLMRSFGRDAALSGGTGFLTEAIVPFDYRRGLTLVFALEALISGSAIIRGLEL